jgi:hypothetical protein
VGPPVSRFDTPCPYSWMMIPFSRSPSRMAGRARLRCTDPAAGRLARMVAASVWETMTAGIVTGGSTDPFIVSTAEPPEVLATTTATAPAFCALVTCV